MLEWNIMSGKVRGHRPVWSHFVIDRAMSGRYEIVYCLDKSLRLWCLLLQVAHSCVQYSLCVTGMAFIQHCITSQQQSIMVIIILLLCTIIVKHKTCMMCTTIVHTKLSSSLLSRCWCTTYTLSINTIKSAWLFTLSCTSTWLGKNDCPLPKLLITSCSKE